MGIPRSLTKIVDRAIKGFEAKHENSEVSASARALLADHARRNKKRIVADLKQRKITQKALSEGLEEVLGYAARLQPARGATYAVAKKSGYGGAVREISTGRFLSTKSEISSRAVRAAMKKKCKTFPWC